MRRAYTLVEVLVAGGVLVVGLLPILTLLTTSSGEVVKARERAVAMGLAISVAEDLALKRDADRVSQPPAAPTALPQLAPILARYDADHPEYASGVDRNLGHFRAGVTVPGNPTLPMQVLVTWSEAGVTQRHELEAVRGTP